MRDSMTHTEVLIDLLRRELPGASVGVEVGVYRGNTSAALLDAFPGLQLTCVDAWRPYPEDRRSQGVMARHTAQQWTTIASAAWCKLERYRDRCRIYDGDSLEQSKRVSKDSVDFVYIDADHSREGFSADLLAWSVKVRPSGLVCGHDYGNTRKGCEVTEVLKESGIDFHVEPAMVWWYRK